MMDAGDVRDGGAGGNVKQNVLYMFWGSVFGFVGLLLFAGYVLVFNMLQAGVVVDLGGLTGVVDPTQALLALGAVGYTLWKVVSIMLVATFGASDVQAGSAVAEETAQEAQDAAEGEE